MPSRILIISPSNEGTIAKCSSNLMEAFKESVGIEVRCVCLYKYNNGETSLSNCEYFIDRSIDEKKDIAFTKKIKWIKQQKETFRPDITISTLYAVSMLNVLAGGKDCKVGVFHSPIAQAKAFGWLYYSLMSLVYYLLFPFLDYCFCVSEESADDLKTFFTIKKDRIKIVYNIHNLERILNLSIEALNEKESEVFKHPVILYCGRLDENKAPKRILDALRYIKNDNVHLVLIGPDPFGIWTDIETSLSGKGLKNRVHYWGSKSNPYKYMLHSSILVSCSYSECLPGVIIEALALGTPVVSTNSSKGVWEIMSAKEQYDKNLSDVVVLEDGVITSNLSNNDTNKYDSDVLNLARGIDTVFSNRPPVSFSFKEEVSKQRIVTQYLDVL